MQHNNNGLYIIAAQEHPLSASVSTGSHCSAYSSKTLQDVLSQQCFTANTLYHSTSMQGFGIQNLLLSFCTCSQFLNLGLPISKKNLSFWKKNISYNLSHHDHDNVNIYIITHTNFKSTPFKFIKNHNISSMHFISVRKTSANNKL